jgi:hypothetical protein
LVESLPLLRRAVCAGGGVTPPRAAALEADLESQMRLLNDLGGKLMDRNGG